MNEGDKTKANGGQGRGVNAEVPEMFADRFKREAEGSMVPEATRRAVEVDSARKIMKQHRKDVRAQRAAGVYHKRVSFRGRLFLNLSSFFMNAAGAAGIAALSYGAVAADHAPQAQSEAAPKVQMNTPQP